MYLDLVCGAGDYHRASRENGDSALLDVSALLLHRKSASALPQAAHSWRRGDVSSDVPGRLCSPDTNRHLNRPRRVSGPSATPVFTVSPRQLTENLSTKYIWYRFVPNIDSSVEYRTLLSMVGANRTNRAWELRYFLSLIDFVLQNKIKLNFCSFTCLIWYIIWFYIK